MRRNQSYIALSFASACLLLAACGDDEGTTGTTDAADTSSQADTVTDPGDAVEDTALDDTAVACPLGDPCDDDDPCTDGDACDAAGACVGAARTCDDGLACTTDSCQADGACANVAIAGFCVSDVGGATACVANASVDPLNGCRLCDTAGGAPAWVALEDGASCEDADACTTGGQCEAGACVADGTLDCETGDPCVAGTCDPQLGCVTADTTAACDDGDPCSLDDVCGGGQCAAGAGTLECDDADACTVDSCVPGQGCVYDPDALCDDGDPCTNDSCEPGGNCVNTAFTGACDDSDPCTIGEACDVAGTCGGGAANTCDDANACTLDSCHPVAGCLNIFLDEPCDDGAECTTDDVCVAGECFGAKTASCDFCNLAGTDHANRITSLGLAGDGNPGSGVDVDGDLTTCAPDSQCGGGVDNALAIAAFLVNDGVQSSIENGTVNWVVDLRHARFDGEEFQMPIYDSGMDDLDEFNGCDRNAETCRYDVAQLSFDQTCTPYFEFDNARITDGKLVAGGENQLISMVLPLEGGELLSLTIAWARVRATYTLVDGKITSMTGVMGGAIPKQQLRDAILGLEPGTLAIDPEAAVALLDELVANDIDLDGDGIKESVSIGMRFDTIPAIILSEP